MYICFGASWPMSINRSYKSRSTKGKSLMFMCFIGFGYLCGIGAKLITGTFNLAFYVLVLNIVLVSTDIGLYFRNKKIEAAEEAKQAIETVEAAEEIEEAVANAEAVGAIEEAVAEHLD
jgi:hypothetical protein